MLRLVDLFCSFFWGILSSPILLVLIVIGYYDTRSTIFFQERVGRNKKPFNLIKFRIMAIGTASVASHLASSLSITKFGNFLSKTRLDELPQLWNFFKGEIGLVGSRPNLFNQEGLIGGRDNRDISNVRSGIIGLAQINNIGTFTPELLEKIDVKMNSTLTLLDYFNYIRLETTLLFKVWIYISSKIGYKE